MSNLHRDCLLEPDEADDPDADDEEWVDA